MGGRVAEASRRLRSVLGHPTSRALLVARAASDVGDFFGLGAIIVLAVRDSGSVIGAGAVFAAQGIAAFLVGVFGGRALSRVHPGRGLVATHVAAGVVVLVIITTPPLPVVLGLVAVLGALRSAASPLRASAIAASVPESLQQQTFGLFGVSYQFGQVIGFIGGAALAAAVDARIALAGDAATFFLGALVLTGAQVRHLPPAEEGPAGAISRLAVMDGMRTVFAHPVLALITPLAWVTWLAAALPETLAPGLIDGPGVGLLMAAAPAGAVVSSVAAAVLPTFGERQLTGLAVAYGMTLLLTGAVLVLGQPVGVVAAMYVLSGLVGGAWIVGAQARFTTCLPPGQVALVVTAMGALVVVLEGVGAFGLAALATTVGAGPPFLLMGAVTVVAGSYAYLQFTMNPTTPSTALTAVAPTSPKEVVA